MSQKSQFSIKKVIKVYRMLDNELQPERYEVWKLSGPHGFVKHFVTKKDAQAYLKSYTSTKIVK